MSGSRRLSFGVHIDPTDPVNSARELEALGYDHLICGEHLAFHGPTTSALVALAAAAAVTRSIRLLTAVVLAPLYPPLLLAKLATSLDIVSAGRLDLGIGVGGDYPPEFEAAGVPLAGRGKRTDETLEVLRLLWMDGTSTYQGRYHHFTNLPFEPKPVQKPHPPIWIGGRSTSAMRRAGRHGDVWLPHLYTPEMLDRSVTVVRDAAHECGRDAERIRVAVVVTVVIHDDAAIARRIAISAMTKIYGRDSTSLVGRYVVHGSPAHVRRRLAEFYDAGARAVLLFIPPSPDNADAARMIAADVVPEFRPSSPG